MTANKRYPIFRFSVDWKNIFAAFCVFLWFQKNELQSNIRHLENQVINLMQTKTSQEKAINDYKTKQSGNEEKIKNMSNDLEENKEKLEAAEQVNLR